MVRWSGLLTWVGLLCAAPTSVFPQSRIAPEVVLKLDQCVSHELNGNGRWFSCTTKHDQRRRTRVFDLDQRPPRESGPDLVFGDGRVDATGRWLVDYVSVNPKDASWNHYRLWDLHAPAATPRLSLDPSYSEVTIHPTGAWLVGVRIGADPKHGALHAWDLGAPDLGNYSYRRVGTTIARTAHRWFILAQETRRVVGVTDEGLMLWDLDQPRKAPIKLSTDGGVRDLDIAFGYWRDQGTTPRGSRCVSWRDAAGGQSMVDINADSPTDTVRAVSKDILVCTRRYLLESRDRDYWLTDFDRPPAARRLFTEPANSRIDTQLFLPGNRWLLTTFVPSWEAFQGFEAYLIRVDESQPTVVLERGPITVAQRNVDGPIRIAGPDMYGPQMWSYEVSRDGRWLVGFSGAATKYWDLQAVPEPRLVGEMPGLTGKISHSALVGQRWLILINQRRQAYFVDLDARRQLEAVPFFQFEEGKIWDAGADDAGRRFFVVTPSTAYIWNVAAFPGGPG